MSTPLTNDGVELYIWGALNSAQIYRGFLYTIWNVGMIFFST